MTGAREVLAGGLSLGLFSAVLWAQAAGREPLTWIEAAAGFLAVAVWTDVRGHRIPNWLTFPAFGLALAGASFAAEGVGAVSSLLGVVAALALLLVPYSFRALGAGDVKAAMVLGALWGPTVLISVSAWAVLVGGVVGLGWVALRGDLGDLLQRWWRTAWLSVSSRRVMYVPPPPDSAASRGIPFAVALALGVLAHQLLGGPW